MKMTIGFIGAGMTGTALAVRLWQRGYPVVAVSSRSIESARRLSSLVSGCAVCDGPQQVADLAQLIFITTPDDVIPDIAAGVRWRHGQIAVHCSGVHSIDILEPAAASGAHVCCLHPLQTFAGLEEAINNISGSTFALEGDEEGLAAATEMAQALEGNIILLKPGDKVKYHIAAVTLSNYLVALMKTSADLWQSFGIPQEEAVKALLPLLKGTVRNIERVGIPGCLTGPIARGDVETVRKHVGALASGIFGRWFLHNVDRFMRRLPFIRAIYGSAREMTDAVFVKRSSLRKTVIAEYPRPGMWAVGFLTSDECVPLPDGRPALFVFFPTAPNPTSGWLALIPEADITATGMSIDDGLKLVVSGGVIRPESFENWTGQRASGRAATGGQKPETAARPGLR